jgi:hypothetical protein
MNARVATRSIVDQVHYPGITAATGAWICFEDESAQALQPPVART